MIKDQKFIELYNIVAKTEKSELTEDDIDQFNEILAEQKENANQENDEYLSFELSTSYLTCQMYLTLILGFILDSKFQLFPCDYLGKDYKPNPNHFLESTFASVMNHSLSVIRLVHDGLEYSAKVLLRTVKETTELISVVIYDKELLKKYLDAINPEKEYQTWRKYFTPSKLSKKIKEIESELFGNKNLDKIKKDRDDLNSHYSSYVHPSTMVSMLGAHVLSIDTNDYLEANLLGKASETGKSSLYRLCLLNYYMFFLIKTLTYEKEELIYPKDNDRFKEFIDLFAVLHESMKRLES